MGLGNYQAEYDKQTCKNVERVESMSQTIYANVLTIMGIVLIFINKAESKRFFVDIWNSAVGISGCYDFIKFWTYIELELKRCYLASLLSYSCNRDGVIFHWKK